jgi:hypothetical protein
LRLVNRSEIGLHFQFEHLEALVEAALACKLTQIRADNTGSSISLLTRPARLLVNLVVREL